MVAVRTRPTWGAGKYLPTDGSGDCDAPDDPGDDHNNTDCTNDGRVATTAMRR